MSAEVMSAEGPTPQLAPPPQNKEGHPAPSSGNGLAASQQDTTKSQQDATKSQQGAQHNKRLVLYDPYNADVSSDLERGQPTPPSSTPRWQYTLMQIFSWIQLRLPSMYFRRVAAIIQNSDITEADFAKVVNHLPKPTDHHFLRAVWLLTGPVLDTRGIHSMKRFKKKWGAFVTLCMTEWANLNIVSALLLGILLTFLQIDEVGHHPITRSATLLSLTCAFWSLLLGVMYIVQFHSMKGVERGMNWIIAAVQSLTLPHWNMWVFLAMPAVWLVWSLVFFLASILSFIWTSGDRSVPALTPRPDEATGLLPMSFSQFVPLWPRIILTVIFTIGLGSALLVLKTFNDIGANTLQQQKIYDPGSSRGVGRGPGACRCRCGSSSGRDSGAEDE